MDNQTPAPLPPTPEKPFTREQAMTIVKKYLVNPNLVKHCLAAEAAMKGLYNHFYFGKPEFTEKDQETWGITGLLHDADYDISKGRPEIHGLLLFDQEEVQNMHIPATIKHAIMAHNPATNIKPTTQMDWGIRCADQLTGLIVAATLVHPDRKLASITPEFVINRMNEKSFAKGADREPIRQCEEKLNIALTEFITVILKSMQGISTDLGF
jgi:predicted hydrolase (HD superfamily)